MSCFLEYKPKGLNIIILAMYFLRVILVILKSNSVLVTSVDLRCMIFRIILSVVTYFYDVQVYELTSCFCQKIVNIYLLVFTDI